MGLLSYSSILLAGVSLVAGQTPKGFMPEVQTPLSIMYGDKVVSPAGEELPQPDLKMAPMVMTQPMPAMPKGVLFMIDLDVPRNNTRTTLLHWMAPNVDLTKAPAAVPVDQAQGAPYIGPNPPAGDMPHRYVFLLFEQPENFAVPQAFSTINPPKNGKARVSFDIARFAAESGLKQPMAATYITVKPKEKEAGGAGGAEPKSPMEPKPEEPKPAEPAPAPKGPEEPAPSGMPPKSPESPEPKMPEPKSPEEPKPKGPEAPPMTMSMSMPMPPAETGTGGQGGGAGMEGGEMSMSMTGSMTMPTGGAMPSGMNMPGMEGAAATTKSTGLVWGVVAGLIAAFV